MGRSREAEIDRKVLSEIARRMWLAEIKRPAEDVLREVLDDVARRILGSPRQSWATVSKRIATFRAAEPCPPPVGPGSSVNPTGCAA